MTGICRSAALASALGATVGLVLGAGPAQAEQTVSADLSVYPAQVVTTGDVLATPNGLTPGVYVTGVYHDLFGRDPDADGLATWTAALSSGVPLSAVASSITASAEYRGRLVDDAYQSYLQRGAEPGGLATWLGQMSDGRTIEQMTSGIVGSPEAYARAGDTDSAWVAWLYQAVLGRAGQPSEVSWWVSQLQAGATRQQVALGFLMSTEKLTADVDQQYEELLRRGIDPAGAATWVSQLQSGVRLEVVVGSLVSSQEYLNRVVQAADALDGTMTEAQYAQLGCTADS